MKTIYKVSVILPVYNGEKTIQRTLDSLINQTHKDFELICCIDGTNDNSFNIIEANRSKFSHLVVLKNEFNLGLGPVMNRLVSAAQSDYIAVAEQDDYYYENRLQLQVDILDKMPEIGLVSGIADFWDGNKITFRFPGILVDNKKYPKGEDMFLLNYRHQIKVVNSCMMFRKSTHFENGLYFSKHYPNVSVDWSYILRFSLVSEIYGINQSLVLLDRRKSRASITSNKQIQFLAARELIRSFYFEFPHLIKKKDFDFAMTTQYLNELSAINKYKFIPLFIFSYFKNPFDRRWLNYLHKRIKRFIKT